VHEIKEAETIVQKNGRIGKAATPQYHYLSIGRRKGLNLRNSITVSAFLLASVVINEVTAAQTSAPPQITITPTTAQQVITGASDRFTGSFVCNRFSIQLSQAAPAVEQ
jgi:hypothetical protein